MRFIAVLIIAYFVIRFLRGLFQTNVVVKNYHYHENGSTTKRQEGDVKITGGDKNAKHKSDDMGEYVDYEEVD